MNLNSGKEDWHHQGSVGMKLHISTAGAGKVFSLETEEEILPILHILLWKFCNSSQALNEGGNSH